VIEVWYMVHECFVWAAVLAHRRQQFEHAEEVDPASDIVGKHRHKHGVRHKRRVMPDKS